MYFDTHCHLQFSRFKKNVGEVIDRARKVGVTAIVIPGTDIESSNNAITIAEKYEGMYAAVGIHPHHVYEFRMQKLESRIEDELKSLEEILEKDKVVAIGEVGLDRHVYEQTKYASYEIDNQFIQLQTETLKKQVQLAMKYNKSLILHNREAKKELLILLHNLWDTLLEKRTVFHCCEPDQELLNFAKQHKIFIGIDGDITYDEKKQEFIKQVPLEMLVLETDAPFLLPEPLRSRKEFPNEPKNLALIAENIARFKKLPIESIEMQTEQNAKQLFQVQ